MASNIPELFGSSVFNDKVMRAKLPKDIYKALKKTMENGTHLELSRILQRRSSRPAGSIGSARTGLEGTCCHG